MTARARHLLPLTLALALAAPAAAQDEGAAAARREHPDLAFAWTLGHTWEWYDLAFQVLEDLEKSRPAPDVLERGQMLRLDLRRAWAVKLPDEAQRKEALAAVRAEYEDIVRKKPGTAVATEAQLALGEMLMQEGDGAFLRVRTTDDPEARAQARKEAEEKFGQAVKYFEELVQKFREAYDAAEDKNDQAKLDEAHIKLMHARFNRARAIYQHAQLYEKGSKDRDEKLKKAAEQFNAINFDYGDEFLGYEAAIFLGLAAKELGNFEQARAAFISAIAIKDFYSTDDRGRYLMDESGKDVVSRASYFRAQMLNEIKEHEAALEAVKALFEILPALQRDRLGLATRIEEAIAWGGKGDLKRAQTLLDRIMEEDKGGPWAAKARETLGVLMGGGGGLTVAPDQALRTAESMIDRGRPAEGLSQLRNLIALLEQATPEEQQKWLAFAWFRLGTAYSGLNRYDEAVACFEALVTRFKGTEQAPEALFSAAMALSQLNGAKPNDFDKEKYLETLKTLQGDYPKHPAAQASSFFLGLERFSARDYPAAAREFERTTEKAGKIYDAAVYQAALSYTMEALRLAREEKPDEAKRTFAQARLAIEKAIRWAAEDAAKKGEIAPDRAEALSRMAFNARCRLAEVALHPLMKDGAKALAAAAAAEAGLGAEPDRERIAEARLLAIRGHLLTDDVEKAEAVVASLANDAPESARTSRAERLLAVAIDDLAREAQKSKKPEAAELFAKAADHYARWFEVAGKAGVELTPRELAGAGFRLYVLALVVNGLPENLTSFSEVEDLAGLAQPARFATAGAVLQAALDQGAPDPDIGPLVGQCHGFARDFEKARKVLVQACQTEKLLRIEKHTDENGKPVEVFTIDVNVAEKRPILLDAYTDYGRSCYELAAAGKDRKLADEAIDAFGRVLYAVHAGTAPWWRAKYYFFASLYEKGEYDSAKIGLSQLKRQNPGFDGGKYHLKPRFEALLAKLEAKDTGAPKGRPGGKKDKGK